MNNRFRIGKDRTFTWPIVSNDVPLPLEGRELRLEIVDPFGRRTPTPFTVEGNKIKFRFKGIDQQHIGIYSLTLWEYYKEIGSTAADLCNAFEIVETTCQECKESDDLDVELPITNLEVGFHGASAYEVAVEEGFKGSKQEWLESLQGTDGLSSYQIWLLNGNEGSEEEFLQSLKGADGLSAYEEWKKAGNVGSEEDFLQSLKGEPGNPGDDGKDGGIIYPKFRINKGMHLMVSSVGPTDGRFKIDNGHLKLKV